MIREYAEYAANKTIELLNIDSPTGFTKNAALWVKKEFESLGYETSFTNKGCVLIKFNQPETSSDEGGLLFECHTDTLGAMVADIKENGRLKLTALGGLQAANTETENVKIYTRDGKIYEGTIQLCNASSHVNKDFIETTRTYDSIEVVLDEKVSSKKDVMELGIQNGDIVCPDPRSRITRSGYIKSRYLDDKLSVGTILALGKYIKDKKISLNRQVYCLVTVYEEVGHGGSAGIPEDVTEAIAVDMGCVGDGLTCTDLQVSICAKDSGGPYDYEITSKLIEAAKKENADYAVDIYPFYGSDVEATLRSGHDVRHGLIGPGVYASHGYERSSIDAVHATLKVLKGFLNI